MEGLVLAVVDDSSHRFSIHWIELHCFEQAQLPTVLTSSLRSSLMADLQKFVGTVVFGGVYLIAAIRACNWVTSQLSDLNTGMQFLTLPFIAIAIAAPGSFLVFMIWKKG